MAKPKLIAFDLDYTLWPFWVDTHVTPPFTKARDGKTYDFHRQVVKFYPDTPDILNSLKSEGIQLAAVSRTHTPPEAQQLLDLWDWDKFFSQKEIYPGIKVTHFNKIHKNTGIAYKDMLFFDDEHRNIVDISKLGVTCILVEDGMSHAELKRGMEEFAKNAAKRS